MSSASSVNSVNPFLNYSEIHKYRELLSIETLNNLADCLQHSTTLKILELQTCRYQEGAYGQLSALASALGENTTLQMLSFEFTDITTASSALASSLKVNSTLANLNLSYSQVKDEGIVAIGEALAVNSGLTTLILNSNHISGGSFGPFLTGLQANSTLTRLDLKATGLEIEEACAIAAAVKCNAAFSHLDLQNNLLFLRHHKEPNEKAENDFITHLSQIPSLTTLHLGRTGIREKQFSVMLAALPAFPKLESLYLGSTDPEGGSITNIFEPDSVEKLAHTINDLTNLSTLGLSSTGITAAMVFPIAEALKTNSTLTGLNLGRNPLGDRGAGHVAAMLAINSTLTTLSLEDSDATWRTWDYQVNRRRQTIDGNHHILALPSVITTKGFESLEAAMRVNSTMTHIDFHPRLLIQNPGIKSVMLARFDRNKHNKIREQSLFTLLFDRWSSQLTSDVS